MVIYGKKLNMMNNRVTILMSSLNMNGLTTPIKAQELPKWEKKKKVRFLIHQMIYLMT